MSFSLGPYESLSDATTIPTSRAGSPGRKILHFNFQTWISSRFLSSGIKGVSVWS